VLDELQPDKVVTWSKASPELLDALRGHRQGLDAESVPVEIVKSAQFSPALAVAQLCNLSLGCFAAVEEGKTKQQLLHSVIDLSAEVAVRSRNLS